MQIVPAEQPAPKETEEAEPEIAPFAMPPYAWAPMYVEPTESPAPATPAAESESPVVAAASSPPVVGISAALMILLAAGLVVLGRRSRGPKGVSGP
ncbi:hypothetical protein GCM10027404_26460 [Arthrobacter tumbae]|uniref:hypothetical protein n=1 Tax=Arthrobacter tumbae TaxID=163874 RepID=UPI00195803C8|nr:hypothetical protein [Arthrobacter tumbae]MBM7781669.1 hypothetical protein [Arthrobacter tumbae]